MMITLAATFSKSCKELPGESIIEIRPSFRHQRHICRYSMSSKFSRRVRDRSQKTLNCVTETEMSSSRVRSITKPHVEAMYVFETLKTRISSDSAFVLCDTDDEIVDVVSFRKVSTDNEKLFSVQTIQRMIAESSHGPFSAAPPPTE